MHHVALDRSRPHDRDLDHQVVEFLRLEPRQHRHLRAALDLEHADRVGAAEHAVDRGVFGRDRGERELLAVMRFGERQRLAQAGEHAEAEHIDLEDAERVEIVLVPFDEGAVLHRRIGDRHHLVEPAAGHDEAADVLREMAGERQDFVDQPDHAAHTRAFDVEADALEVFRRRPAVARRSTAELIALAETASV